MFQYVASPTPKVTLNLLCRIFALDLRNQLAYPNQPLGTDESMLHEGTYNGNAHNSFGEEGAYW
jgi:hypothetical protein